MSSDLDIARQIKLQVIESIAAKVGIPQNALYAYGPYKAKLSLEYLSKLDSNNRGKLILVTAINPTPAGEGKTTTTIGLGDALNYLGKKTIICVREPSLGPCFGLKGGATGGGHAQVVPMDEINLHFTGDFHAVTSANNLLSAMIDNHIYWGNNLDLDPHNIYWPRAIDMNDRALRNVQINSGRTNQNRNERFVISVATEVMAILCLATSIDDLESRLEKIVVAKNKSGQFVTAKSIGAASAMAVLLKDAIQPNLVQTLFQSPAFVHGGPFANIAHGCNSLISTRAALNIAEYVVTEAGFGADLGAEKFFNIKCRQSGLIPNVAVVVATVRALKMHGGLLSDNLMQENVEAIKRGLPNLVRHIGNIKKFNLPVVVAINHFVSDHNSEIEEIKKCCNSLNVPAHVCYHWAEGAKGAISLASNVINITSNSENEFNYLYDNATPLEEKIRIVAYEIYGAGSVTILPEAQKKLAEYTAIGFGHLPICMAKTPFSFSADPKLIGAPSNFDFPIRDVQLSAGAGFVIAFCGEVLTMPGLPQSPAAERIFLDNSGNVQGLY